VVGKPTLREKSVIWWDDGDDITYLGLVVWGGVCLFLAERVNNKLKT